MKEKQRNDKERKGSKVITASENRGKTLKRDINKQRKGSKVIKQYLRIVVKHLEKQKLNELDSKVIKQYLRIG